MSGKVDMSQYAGKHTEKTLSVSYSKRDLLVYAVSIGCNEEKFTYELNKDFQMFPTFPVTMFFPPQAGEMVPITKHPMRLMVDLPFQGKQAREYGVRTAVDGQRSIECVKPLPIEGGNFIFRNTHTAILRKGGGKGLASEGMSQLEDEQGNVYYKFWDSLYCPGKIVEFDDVGVSGEQEVSTPNRAPDAAERFLTSPLQALMYRLTGDLNNVHVDKNLAKNLGYVDNDGNGQGILQGLGSLGIAARAVLRAFGKNEGKAFHSVYCRFSTTVQPGQNLETRMWNTGNAGGAPGTKRVIFETVCVDTGKTVLSNAFMDLKEAEMGPEDISKDTWRANSKL